MLDTHMCQAAEVRPGWDIKETDEKDLRQKDGSHGEEPAPIPIEKSNPITRVGENSALLSKSQLNSEAESYAEVTSPHEPMNWAQTHEANADQTTAQEIVKSRKGKGCIKKIAREKGLTQSKEK